MNPSIPASQFVDVIPSVLEAGAADLAMNTVMLDNTGDTSQPIGTLGQFGNAAAVAAWYGASSVQAALANIYFAGYNGGTRIPSALYFAQYNTSAVAAYLRGGTLSGLTLAQLQAFSGTITVAVNGRTVTSAAINLASATSFTNAAALITTGLQTAGGIFTGTGTISNGSGGSGTVLNISAVTSGALHVGDVVTGVGVTSGTTIISFGSGTGGVGSYNVSVASDVTVGETIEVTSAAVCTYDSLRVAFVITSPTVGVNSTIAAATDTSLSPHLNLTAATGAVTSQGAAAATPAGLMNTVTGLSTDWATFMTIDDPDAGAAGGPIKQAFSTWNAGQNDAYLYVAFDSDPTPSTGTDAACFATQVEALNGTFALWSSTQGASDAAFVCGTIASINFTQPGGRITLAYRSSPALAPDVSNLSEYLYLTGNGYNCYANVATRTAQFQWLQPGSVSGAWDWADSYVNQIYWNARFQNDFAELLTQVNSIPYTQAGYNLIRECLAPDIQAMGAFGAWRSGVALSGSEAVAVNTAAGLTISNILTSQGWYLQIEDPGATVRAERGSPNVTYWYTDGDAVQQIRMGSIDIE
jgi:hypothetical protein